MKLIIKTNENKVIDEHDFSIGRFGYALSIMFQRKGWVTCREAYSFDDVFEAPLSTVTAIHINPETVEFSVNPLPFNINKPAKDNQPLASPGITINNDGPTLTVKK